MRLQAEGGSLFVVLGRLSLSAHLDPRRWTLILNGYPLLVAVGPLAFGWLESK